MCVCEINVPLKICTEHALLMGRHCFITIKFTIEMICKSSFWYGIYISLKLVSTHLNSGVQVRGDDESQSAGAVADSASIVHRLTESQIRVFADYSAAKTARQVLLDFTAANGNAGDVPATSKIYLEEFMALEKRLGN